jgi:hypothetical protein
MNSKEELREWAAGLIGDEQADIVVEGLLQPGHPPFGSDWAPYLEGLNVWLIAHAKWRIKEMGMTGTVDVKPHGRGIRLICGDWNLYHTDFDSIDNDLNELQGLFQ